MLADSGKAKLFLTEVEVKEGRATFISELKAPTPLLEVHALKILGFKVNSKTDK